MPRSRRFVLKRTIRLQSTCLSRADVLMPLQIAKNDPYTSQRMPWRYSGKLIEDANSTPQRELFYSVRVSRSAPGSRDKAYDRRDDRCQPHFGAPRQHEARNERSKYSDRSVLDQEPAFHARQVSSRLTARTFAANQARIVGYAETLRLMSRVVLGEHTPRGGGWRESLLCWPCRAIYPFMGCPTLRLELRAIGCTM